MLRTVLLQRRGVKLAGTTKERTADRFSLLR